VAPRHIEIQVFADRYGHAIHLGERDCSVQRRHQKIIEEAPSPSVNAALRERMGATAVAAAKAIGYEGAGTLEFLLDGEGNYYFMEMNTRLQVEHPVTEAITGLDLVELQLRVAAGETLAVAQEEVRFDGHAIEVRLCAEDAAQGFMPQSGTMAQWRMPPQLRVEHALRSGAEIPPFYDSMIAKLVAHGRTREEARRKLMSGLEDAVALGVTTNQFFLQRCLAHPVFAAGGASTAFIDQHREELLAPDSATQDRAAALAAVLLCESTGDRSQQGRRIAHTLPISLRFARDGQMLDAGIVRAHPDRFSVRIGDGVFEIDRIERSPPSVRFSCNRLAERAAFHRDGSLLLLHYRGRQFRIEDHTRAAALKSGDAAGDGKLRASMNGRVVCVMVAVGDTVQAGQPMLTLEAMKMEHVHAAPSSGRVTALHVKTGDQVAASGVVAELAIGLRPLS
jgi:geranyl-CoA carboxylase alpha subunit